MKGRRSLSFAVFGSKSKVPKDCRFLFVFSFTGFLGSSFLRHTHISKSSIYCKGKQVWVINHCFLEENRFLFCLCYHFFSYFGLIALDVECLNDLLIG